jgi:hypothetical protein
MELIDRGDRFGLGSGCHIDLRIVKSQLCDGLVPDSSAIDIISSGQVESDINTYFPPVTIATLPFRSGISFTEFHEGMLVFS